MTEPTMPMALPDGALRARENGAPIDPRVIDALRARGVPLTVDERTRLDHGRDWWPVAVGWLHNGAVPAVPGVVVTPRTLDELVATVSVASELHVALTAQGGRSSIVGGAVPSPGGIALDTTSLSRVLAIDEVSGTVEVEAGCFGPELEAAVNERGLTVGHFPQSFDLATVGGWLACRGAGQYSNRFGKIEDIVRGLTVVLADGRVVRTGGRGPRQAVGPDLTQLFVGSEGTLGVIYAATLVARRRAAFEQRAAYSFSTFSEGLAACREILQQGASPAVLRLYDVAESTRTFEVDRCVLIVIDEGDPSTVAASMAIVGAACAGARAEPVELVEHWREHRNDVGALAPLWERGIVVDTIEVAGPWSVLDDLGDAVTAALRAVEGTVVASVHQSHAYLDGACLYFTFAGRPSADPDAYYRRAWDVASAATLAAGGALSHHHGVGRNRARFLDDALGSGADVLRAMKDTLDPHHILNPGVLGLGGPAW